MPTYLQYEAGYNQSQYQGEEAVISAVIYYMAPQYVDGDYAHGACGCCLRFPGCISQRFFFLCELNSTGKGFGILNQGFFQNIP